MAKGAKFKLLDELVIKVNSRALKAAVVSQEQLSARMEDSAAGTELLNEQLVKTNSALTEARKLSRGLANSLEGVGGDAKLQDYFDGVVMAIQDVEGVLGDLGEAFQEYASIAKQGNDDVIVTLEKLLDPLRKVDKSSKKTQDGLDDLGGALADVGTQAGKAGKGVEGAGRQSKNGTRSFQDLAKLAGPLPMIYATIAANVYALTEAYEQLAAGDRLNRLQKINEVVGAETGVAISNLADIMVEATGYAIGFDNAMQKAAQASAYGFSPDQVEQFTLAARRASVALGVDLDDALNRIIRGVSKLEIELLDELGITVRLTEAYDKYAKSLGISVNSLTGYQKQQAYANAVIQESTARFGYLGSAIEATEWEKLAQGIDQTTKSGQKWIANFLQPAAKHFNTLFAPDSIEEAIKGLDAMAKSQALAGKNGNVLQAANLQVSGEKTLQSARAILKQKTDEYEQSLQATQQAEKKYGQQNSIARQENAKQKKAIDQLNRSIKEQEQQYENQLGSVIKYAKGTQDYGMQMQNMVRALAESKSLSKSLTESVSTFEKSLKPAVHPIELISAEWKQAYENVQDLKKAQQDLKNVPGQDTARDDLTKRIDNTLTQQGVDNFEQLEGLVSQSATYQELLTTNIRQSNVEAAKLAKTSQFSQGVTGAILENERQAALIRKQLSQATQEGAEGNVKELMGIEEKNALTAELLNLDKERLVLSSQQNDIATQYKVTLQETQQTQAILANGDPLKQQLSSLDQQIVAYKELSRLNSGLSKPEDQAKNEQMLVQLLQSRRDILRQIQGRELEVQSQQAEVVYETSTLNSLLNDRYESSRQDLQYMQTKLELLDREVKLAKEYGATQNELLAFEAERLRIRQDMVNANRSQMENRASAQSDEIQLRGQEMGLSELDIINEQVKQKQEFISQLEKEKVGQQAILEQSRELRDLMVQQQNLKKAEDVKGLNSGLGALGSAGSVPTIQAPTGIGEKQLQDQQLATSMDAINKSFSELSSYNPAMSDMIANVSNLGLAFHQMGEGAATGQQVAAQGMSTVASMLNMVAQQTISGFDQQIAAEKNRDGKSAESLKKIQKLEAEKAQQQKKAATQQIVMQTAMGITQALASLPPPVSYAMAATTQLMGMAALKSQQSGTSVPSVSEASVPSLSLGERDNRVDVSRDATAGELTYIQGGNGVGNSSNFKPRQVGNRAPANHSVMLGENGPEVVSFDTPGTVTAQNKVNSGQTSSAGNVYQIYAMDSESFQEFLNRNGNAVANSVEGKLNSEGKSLYS